VSIKKRVTHPYKYWLLKGCFGGSKRSKRSKRDVVKIGNSIGIHNDELHYEISNAFKEVLNNPRLAFNMRKVTDITINGGLMLKAFFQEFQQRHGKKPYIKGPTDKKMKAVLKHLEIKNYSDVNVENYPDIKCWQIYSWDDSYEVEFSKLLDTEIIPACWKGSHTISEQSSSIATSVAETILNCKEHAYTGAKKNSKFRNFYLGVGEYPDDKHRFSFCIYDKGIGIKARLQSNPKEWYDDFIDNTIRTDSQMIEMATKGKRVTTEDGRGEGLKNAIELLGNNNGWMDIYSDKGYYSSYDNSSGKDRDSELEGTMVSFSFSLKYNDSEVKV